MSKWIFDRLMAFVGLLFFWPVLLVVAILISIRMPDGPIIFKQRRVGLNGKLFTMYKFRTMTVNHDGSSVSVAGESRITPLGQVLRKYKLDELPELWNVFIGDMSFVGPRPERRYFIELIMKENPNYEYIFLMRPGVTSKATLYNGYTDTMQKMLIRLDMDLDYFQRRSLWMDLKVIYTTASFILRGKKF